MQCKPNISPHYYQIEAKNKPSHICEGFILQTANFATLQTDGVFLEQLLNFHRVTLFENKVFRSNLLIKLDSYTT